jgi:hypothetical protein
MNGRRWALAALATTALWGAGCSNAPSETDADGASVATGGKQAVRFAQCMRENGIAAFPDPDASGELSIDGVLNGSSLDSSSPAWKDAIGACKDQQPPGFTGQPRSAEEQDAALRFARCVRDNGVEDFPDPTEGEPLVDTNRIPSTARPGGMDLLHAAMQQCSDAAAQAGVEGPR